MAIATSAKRPSEAAIGISGRVWPEPDPGEPALGTSTEPLWSLLSELEEPEDLFGSAEDAIDEPSPLTRDCAGAPAGVGSKVTQPIPGKYVSAHACASKSGTT